MDLDFQLIQDFLVHLEHPVGQVDRSGMNDSVPQSCS
jgi:hypothetical protein